MGVRISKYPELEYEHRNLNGKKSKIFPNN
jgi:hypothetical protein